MANAVLLVACPDRRGSSPITSPSSPRTAATSSTWSSTPITPTAFFQRVEFELDGFRLAATRSPPSPAGRAVRDALVAALHRRTASGRDPRVAGAALPRRSAQPLAQRRPRVDIPVVVSNHPDHADMAASPGVEYRHRDRRRRQGGAGGRIAQASQLTSRPRRARPLHAGAVAGDVQAGPDGSSTSTTRSCRRSRRQAVPPGARAGRQGDRCHRPLRDRGPRRGADHRAGRDPVSHRDDVDDLRRKGRDLEDAVLARVVHAHLDHRILVYGRRTVVFD